MATLQYQNGSYLVTVPKDIVEKTLKAKKGDKLHYNLTGKGEVQIIVIKEELK